MMVGYLPKWLSPFLGADYFAQCGNHLLGKNEKNYFCIDCVEGPICQVELLQQHAKHRTLQVRRASHVNAVRISDIHRLIDVSDIQSYVINSAKIVFLLSRPQQKVVKGARHWCTSCGRTIADAVKYCSISCKLAGLTPGHTGATKSDQEDAFSTKAEVSETESFEPSTPPLSRSRKPELIQAPAKRPRLVFAVRLKKYTTEEDETLFSSFIQPSSTLPPAGYEQHSGVPGFFPNAVQFKWAAAERGASGSLRIRPRKGMPHRSPLF